MVALAPADVESSPVVALFASAGWVPPQPKGTQNEPKEKTKGTHGPGYKRTGGVSVSSASGVSAAVPSRSGPAMSTMGPPAAAPYRHLYLWWWSLRPRPTWRTLMNSSGRALAWRWLSGRARRTSRFRVQVINLLYSSVVAVQDILWSYRVFVCCLWWFSATHSFIHSPKWILPCQSAMMHRPIAAA